MRSWIFIWTLTDKSATFWDGCITHKLWSPSELCSSSQTSNNKMFIAPKSIICCVQTIHSVWYFPLKSLLLILLFSCRLVTPETMMSFLCTEFSYPEKHSTNLIYRFEISVMIWEMWTYTWCWHTWLHYTLQHKKTQSRFFDCNVFAYRSKHVSI